MILPYVEFVDYLGAVLPQPLKPLDPSLSSRDRFGAELRSLRLANSMTQAELASFALVSADQIGKVEKAERWPTLDLATRCDRVLFADGVLVASWYEVDTQRKAAVSCVDAAGLARSEHWQKMLTALAAADNVIGGNGLLDVVTVEIGTISSYTQTVRSPMRGELDRIRARWLEFGSWVADNEDQHVRAARWLREAESLAERTNDRVLAAYVAMRRAQRACEAGNGVAALSLVTAASDSTAAPRVRALLSVREAHAHALSKEHRGVSSAFDTAYRQLDRQDCASPEDAALASHCTVGYVRAYEAYCRLLLGDQRRAICEYQDLLAGWPVEQRLDEGLFRAHLGLAFAADGQLEAAAVEGTQAAKLGSETGSRRTLRAVRQLAGANAEVGRLMRARLAHSHT